VEGWYGGQGFESEHGKDKGVELMLDRCRNPENIHVESVAKELAQTLSSVRHARPGYTRDAVG
jgi:hypothetical protein